MKKRKKMTFESFELNPAILKAVIECGYTAPTPVQEQAIPVALSGKDLMASAQTGTGKTAAFVLPALQRIIATPAKGMYRGPRILVLTPTRELANQINDAAKDYGKYMRFKCACILGGMPYREQLKRLSAQVDMVVATPGRLIDLLDRGSINLSQVEMLVLDEADRMLDMGFIDDVRKIAAVAPKTKQTLLFTATLDDAMARLAERLLNEPVRIAVAGKKATLENIEQMLHVADSADHKDRMLQHLVSDVSLTRAIIFSATKVGADKLARRLNKLGHTAAALHGDMDQRSRNITIADMRRGRVRLLVATDVAARGLDVTGISHVINFDLPKFAEDYVHRIGRTGRAGAAGIAISFASQSDLLHLERIERYTGERLAQCVIPGLEPEQPLRRRTPVGNNRNHRPAPARNNARYAPGPRRNDGGYKSEGGARPNTTERPARDGRPVRDERPAARPAEFRAPREGRPAARPTSYDGPRDGRTARRPY